MIADRASLEGHSVSLSLSLSWFNLIFYSITIKLVLFTITCKKNHADAKLMVCFITTAQTMKILGFKHMLTLIPLICPDNSISV